MAKRDPPPEPDSTSRDPRTGEYRFDYEPRPNGQAKAGPEPLETFSLADLDGLPLPERQFLDRRGLFPCRNVTLLSGDGGTGKSLMALQLIIAVALGGSWLGIQVNRGAALYLSAEESRNENHRRAAAICAAEGLDFADLGAVRIASLAGEDATLALDFKGILVPTELFKQLAATLGQHRPALLVVDNLADVFGGNEISRVQAKRFVTMLRGLAIEHDCCILLLGHPSLSGLDRGTGTSGSTAWSNSVRARLYLKKVDDGLDPNARMLEVMKANYGQSGDVINVRFDNGLFICTDKPERAGSDIGRADRARRVFLELLKLHNERGINVSANPTAPNYAPLKFAIHPKSENVGKRGFARAMENLLDKGEIVVVPYQHYRKVHHRLEVAKCNF